MKVHNIGAEVEEAMRVHRAQLFGLNGASA